MEEEKFTKEEFFRKIESGEIKLSVKQIKGLHGGKYSRDPAEYGSNPDDWSNIELTIGPNTAIMPIITVNGVVWFHFPIFLRTAGLLTAEFSDIAAYCKTVPYPLKRYYQPFCKGTKRVFVRGEALEQLGFTANGKPIIKNKYNFEFNGIVRFNINIEQVERSFMKIMNKLKSIEDVSVLCDVHRILKQL